MNIDKERIIKALKSVTNDKKSLSYLGAKLKKIRKNKNMSLEDVCQENFSIAYLSNIENGHTKIKENVLSKISESLKLNEEEIEIISLNMKDEIIEKGFMELFNNFVVQENKEVIESNICMMDYKIELYRYGYYVTNSYYNEANELYEYLEKQVQFFNRLELGFFTILVIHNLILVGKYFEAYNLIEDVLDEVSFNRKEILLLHVYKYIVCSLSKRKTIKQYNLYSNLRNELIESSASNLVELIDSIFYMFDFSSLKIENKIKYFENSLYIKSKNKNKYKIYAYFENGNYKKAYELVSVLKEKTEDLLCIELICLEMLDKEESVKYFLNENYEKIKQFKIKKAFDLIFNKYQLEFNEYSKYVEMFANNYEYLFEINYFSSSILKIIYNFLIKNKAYKLASYLLSKLL